MSDLEVLLAEVRELAAKVRAEAHADRYAFAALVVFLEARGAVNGRGLAAFLKERSAVDDGEQRGDRATLFVLGQMIEEFLERPESPAASFTVIEGGKSA